MDTGLRNPVLRVLVYGHAWLALGAAAQTWFVQGLMDRHGWRAPVLAALVTFIGYTFMRLARADHPLLGQAPHLHWTRANARSLVLAAGAAVLVAAVIAWPCRAALWSRSWPVAVVVSLYAVPARWVQGRTLGLRRVPLLKAFLIAACWAWVTVMLPAVMGPEDAAVNGIGWIVAMQFCFFLAIALVFDLRDAEQDRGMVITWPHLLGARLIKVLAVILMLYPLLVFVMLAWIGRSMSGAEGTAEWPMHHVLAALGHAAGALVIAGSSPRRGPLYFGLLLDGLLLLVPLLYAVGRWL